MKVDPDVDDVICCQCKHINAQVLPRSLQKVTYGRTLGLHKLNKWIKYYSFLIIGFFRFEKRDILIGIYKVCLYVEQTCL